MAGLPRSSGVLLHVTSLPGAHGIGEAGSRALAFVDAGGFGSLGGALLVAIICGLMSSYGVQFVSQLGRRFFWR
mgnify:CR=1 FL=1